MIGLQEMNRDELLAVINMKTAQIRELEEEIDAYKTLVEELQARLGPVVPEMGFGD